MCEEGFCGSEGRCCSAGFLQDGQPNEGCPADQGCDGYHCCILPSAPPPPPPGECEDWCKTHTGAWEGAEGKCTFPKCSSCDQCDCPESCKTSTTPDWATKCATDECKACDICAPDKGCKGWCALHTSDWADKCSSFVACNGCKECKSEIDTDKDCPDWCDSHTASWDVKCSTFTKCQPCKVCNGGVCEEWCATHTGTTAEKCAFKACSTCEECSNVEG